LNWKNNPTLDETSNDYLKFLADLRGELLARWVNGSDWKDLAAEAGLGANTVKRFVEGKTDRPHLFTVNCLAKAAGYRVTLVLLKTPKMKCELG